MSLLLAALLLPIAGSAAAPSGTLPLPQLVSQFETICLEHVGDPTTQIETAAASPWKFVPDTEAVAGESRFVSGPTMLWIEPAGQVCSVTAEVPLAETIGTTQAALAEIVTPENWKPLPSDDSRYTLIALEGSGTQFVISFKLSSKTGRNLATLYVGKR